MPTALQRELKERALARAQLRAARARAKAKHHYNASGEAVRGIEPGQPVLVGHHSEGRHRRALARSDAHMRKSCDAYEVAEAAENDAKFADRRAGRAVLGRDPEALIALGEKLASLEAERDGMKAVNAAYRRGGWDAAEALDGLRGMVKVAQASMRLLPYQDRPFPSYALTNIGANIRRVRARIAALEAKRSASDRTIEFDGGVVEEDVAADRIRIVFDERVSRENYREMRRRGFRFARSCGGFQRHLNLQGRRAVRSALADLFGVELDSDAPRSDS